MPKKVETATGSSLRGRSAMKKKSRGSRFIKKKEVGDNPIECLFPTRVLSIC